MPLGGQSVDLNQKIEGRLHDSGKAAGVVVAQQLALPVDEVHASARPAIDLVVSVLWRIIVIRPVLDLKPSGRASEKESWHLQIIRNCALENLILINFSETAVSHETQFRTRTK